MIGTILAGTLGTLGLGASIWNANQQNKISQDNLSLQKENLEYQKALQQQLFEREDTSYERTKQDMLNSGFSPLAMQGLNSAGSTVQTSAPQQTLDIGSSLSSILGVASQAQALSQVQSGIAKNDAEARYINAQAETQEIKNLFAKENENLNQKMLTEDYYRKARENFTDNFAGVTSSMPDVIKSILYSSAGIAPTRRFGQSYLKDGTFYTDWKGFSPTSSNEDYENRDTASDALKNYKYTQDIGFWTSLIKGFF